MYRRHLRTEDGIVLCLHLLGEESSLIICRTDITYVISFIPDSDGSDKGSYSYTCRTEVIDLINLKDSVNLIRSCENVSDLIHRHGIKSASKGIELYEVNIFSVFYKLGSSVKSCVIHPLVCNDDGTLHLSEMGYGIFRKHRKIIAGDKLRNSMVYLGIHMIRSSCKNYSPVSGFLHPVKSFLTLFLHILMGTLKFKPCFMGCSSDFILSDIP